MPSSVPRVADVTLVRGAGAPRDAVPRLLVEMPHGATAARHFDDLAAELRGPFPRDLRHFFFVNTDVGSAELGSGIAREVVARAPAESVLLVRSLIPRTFVDCNRVLDDAPPAASGMTPGLPPYVRDARDAALLLERHRAYTALVRGAYEAVCGDGGRALMVHTYAPRSVDVAVDDDIVRSLHVAYRPERVWKWPLRSPADLITRDPEGRSLADPALVAGVTRELAALGIGATENATYALHPVTSGAVLAAAYPGRTLCFEIRRDLVVPAFTPFDEMTPDTARVDRIAVAVARAVVAARASA